MHDEGPVWLELGKSLIVFTGIFFLLSYVAGRIYLNSYLGHFEVTTEQVGFSPEDIMFRSGQITVSVFGAGWTLVLLFTRTANSTEQTADLKSRDMILLTCATGLTAVLAFTVKLAFSDLTSLVTNLLALGPLCLMIILAPIAALTLQEPNRNQNTILWISGLGLVMLVLLQPLLIARGKLYWAEHAENLVLFEIRSDKKVSEEWIEEPSGVYLSKPVAIIARGSNEVVAWDRPTNTVIAIPTAQVLSIRHGR